MTEPFVRPKHAVYAITAKCTECDLCIPVCPTHAIFLGVSQMVIDVDECNGCGICPAICPEHAIVQVGAEPKK